MPFNLKQPKGRVALLSIQINIVILISVMSSISRFKGQVWQLSVERRCFEGQVWQLAVKRRCFEDQVWQLSVEPRCFVVKCVLKLRLKTFL